MEGMTVDVWLYGALARHGGDADQGSFANVPVRLPVGSTMRDLLSLLGVPSEARGITFISGQLSAMPSLQPDLDHILQEGDRVGMFDLKSMWPSQYRHGAAMVTEMVDAVTEGDRGLHHSYRK